jgi:hypothetical protein
MATIFDLKQALEIFSKYDDEAEIDGNNNSIRIGPFMDNETGEEYEDFLEKDKKALLELGWSPSHVDNRWGLRT